MKKVILTVMAVLSIGQLAQAFCGFYVAKAGAELYNNKSEVILVRDGKNTIITMSNDFTGSVKDFAMVVPVPNVLKREDIKIADRSIFQQLDAYSAPRLVEYYDANPCSPTVDMEEADKMLETTAAPTMSVRKVLENKVKYKVKIEAQYKVEEYDIILLSATHAGGLKRWLLDNGYSISGKAEHVLEPYIKSGLKFFVVKVDLNKYNPQSNGGFLRPLQIKVKSEKFMLPIRLGMANANGEQDLLVYAFSRKGRVECTNYRTVKMPTNKKVPTFIKPNFGNFYADVFRNSHARQGRDAVFLEYAWNVTPTWGGRKCDPCVGPPPYQQQFVMAGIPWINQQGATTYFTRLHVKYSLDKFPEDLFFQETPNREMYQARYVITHPTTGDLSCKEGKVYKAKLKLRRRLELSELASLSQWDTEDFYDYVANGTDKVKSVSDEDENSFIPVSHSPQSGGGLPFVVFVFSLLLFGAYTYQNLLSLKGKNS
ncbi:DUF2330 domain-containing protein [Bacteroidia bacterium]|nr:DUF2330 domain-containing protein [Bacteroidia bacterium]MDC1395440.1 DUF2330 domain-containing protein [Bacteroidia bacterium]